MRFVITTPRNVASRLFLGCLLMLAGAQLIALEPGLVLIRAAGVVTAFLGLWMFLAALRWAGRMIADIFR